MKKLCAKVVYVRFIEKHGAQLNIRFLIWTQWGGRFFGSQAHSGHNGNVFSRPFWAETKTANMATKRIKMAINFIFALFYFFYTFCMYFCLLTTQLSKSSHFYNILKTFWCLRQHTNGTVFHSIMVLYSKALELLWWD